MNALARNAFVWGTRVVGASVLIQFLLAGLGIFTYPGFFVWHATVNAAIVFFGSLLLVLAGWLGKVPARLIWLAAALPALTILQSLLLLPYHLNAQGVLRAISSLHVLNAIFIFWVALQLLERTRDWSPQQVNAVAQIELDD